MQKDQALIGAKLVEEMEHLQGFLDDLVAEDIVVTFSYKNTNQLTLKPPSSFAKAPKAPKPILAGEDSAIKVEELYKKLTRIESQVRSCERFIEKTIEQAIQEHTGRLITELKEQLEEL